MKRSHSLMIHESLLFLSRVAIDLDSTISPYPTMSRFHDRHDIKKHPRKCVQRDRLLVGEDWLVVFGKRNKRLDGSDAATTRVGYSISGSTLHFARFVSSPSLVFFYSRFRTFMNVFTIFYASVEQDCSLLGRIFV